MELILYYNNLMISPDLAWYSDPDWWSAIGTIFVGLVAVMIALFQEKIRRFFSNTELEVILRTAPPDCHKIEVRTPNGLMSDGYYVRAKINNIGKYTAENVEVMIVDLHKYNDNGVKERVVTFLPMNLVWSHYGGVSMSRILPNHFRHIDIGCLLLLGSNKVVLKIDTATQPNKVEGGIYPNIIEFGHYEFTLIIGADNVSTFSQKYSFIFSNDFYNNETDMFDKSLKIESL